MYRERVVRLGRELSMESAVAEQPSVILDPAAKQHPRVATLRRSNDGAGASAGQPFLAQGSALAS